jgi:hypothetical protein
LTTSRRWWEELTLFSKATFEESTDILLNAAMRTEIENNAGVSAAIISGNQPKVGTGFMGLLVDHQKIIDAAINGYDEDDEDDHIQPQNEHVPHKDKDEYVPDDDF